MTKYEEENGCKGFDCQIRLTIFLYKGIYYNEIDLVMRSVPSIFRKGSNFD